MPFCILTGLVVFAAGLVRIVEIGAASQSKTGRDRDVKIVKFASPPPLAYQLADDKHRDAMGVRSARLGNDGAPRNQVAYQLLLQSKAQRSLLESISGSMQKPAGSSDLIDWSLLEPGSEDPRSTLQRGVSQR